MRRQYLICYDIAHPGRLRRVHRTVRDFGDALQYSVFSCSLSKKDLAVLEARLRPILHCGEDQVLLIDLGPEHSPAHCRTLGRAIESGLPAVLVF